MLLTEVVGKAADTDAVIAGQVHGLKFGADSDGGTVVVAVNGTEYKGEISGTRITV